MSLAARFRLPAVTMLPALLCLRLACAEDHRRFSLPAGEEYEDRSGDDWPYEMVSLLLLVYR